MPEYREFGCRFIVCATWPDVATPAFAAYRAMRARASDSGRDLDFDVRSLRATFARRHAAPIMSSKEADDLWVGPEDSSKLVRFVAPRPALLFGESVTSGRTRPTAMKNTSYSPNSKRATLAPKVPIAPMSS